MLNQVKSMPPGATLMLTVFLFAAAFSAFHLVKGVATLNVHLISARPSSRPQASCWP